MTIDTYTGIGFEKRYYPQEFAAGYDTYFSAGDVTDEDYMFDGVLFSQNLEFITRRIRENPTLPLFNYIIGMYGHAPHDLNNTKRPMVTKIPGKYMTGGWRRQSTSTTIAPRPLPPLSRV